MKRLAIVLAIIAVFAVSSCTEAKSDSKDQTKAEQAALQKPEAPAAKTEVKQDSKATKPKTLQDLQNERLVLQIRMQGAEAAVAAGQRLVDQARVDLELLNRQIAEMTPKDKAPNPDKK